MSTVATSHQLSLTYESEYFDVQYDLQLCGMRVLAEKMSVKRRYRNNVTRSYYIQIHRVVLRFFLAPDHCKFSIIKSRLTGSYGAKFRITAQAA